MITSKKISKALFEIDKRIIFMMLMIITFNITINILVATVFNTREEAVHGIFEQLILYIIMFGFIYLLTYASSQSVTTVPYLVSLNCPKKLLAKTITIKGLSRSGFITLIFLIIKLFVFKTEYMLFKTIFGINILSLEIIDILMILSIFFLLAYFTYSIFVFFCLTGLNFGWQYVLTSIFILIGSCFFLFKQIVLLVSFGVGVNMFILTLILLNVILSLSNYKFIKNFEYKV